MFGQSFFWIFQISKNTRTPSNTDSHPCTRPLHNPYGLSMNNQQISTEFFNHAICHIWITCGRWCRIVRRIVTSFRRASFHSQELIVFCCLETRKNTLVGEKRRSQHRIPHRELIIFSWGEEVQLLIVYVTLSRAPIRILGTQTQNPKGVVIHTPGPQQP